MLRAENLFIRHITENMKCDAANNNKNRKCSSLYSNTDSCQYTGSIRVS